MDQDQVVEDESLEDTASNSEVEVNNNEIVIINNIIPEYPNNINNNNFSFNCELCFCGFLLVSSVISIGILVNKLHELGVIDNLLQ